MDYNVKTILEKYWNGESTLEEERILRDYFQQETIDPTLEKYRGLFNFYTTQKSVEMTKGIETESLVEKKIEAEKPKTKIRFLIRMAAAVAIFVGLFAFYNNLNTNQQKTIVWEDTYETEEEALAKAKEVLLLVSRKMNKGTDKVAHSLGKVEVATKMVKE